MTTMTPERTYAECVTGDNDISPNAYALALAGAIDRAFRSNLAPIDSPAFWVMEDAWAEQMILKTFVDWYLEMDEAEVMRQIVWASRLFGPKGDRAVPMDFANWSTETGGYVKQ